MTNYQKYTWICPSECDALIEYTFKDGYGWPAGEMNLTCRCGASCILLSVVDATISTPTTKEEQMETTEKTLAELYNNSAKIIVKNTNSGELVYDELSPYDVNCLLTDNHLYKKQNSKLSSQIEAVKEIIIGAYEDSGDQDSLREIAEALDIQLTKTIEWTATMYVSGSIEVDIFEDFDIESELTDNLQISAWSGDIEVEEYHVEDVRES
jgi:malonyl CoA-acyl carrier protein transacylase